MLYAKWIHGSDDISPAKAVREQVFVSEQGFAPEEEFDTFDNGAWHVVAMEDETPIGTGLPMLFDFLDEVRILK